MSTCGSSMHGTGCGCCVRSRGMLGERKSLRTLQKQTLQSSMAYSDALTMKLLESQPTRLLFNVTGSAKLTVCPSHSPPPQSQPCPPCPGFTSLRIAQPLLLHFSSRTQYMRRRLLPLIHCVCPLK